MRSIGWCSCLVLLAALAFLAAGCKPGSSSRVQPERIAGEYLARELISRLEDHSAKGVVVLLTPGKLASPETEAAINGFRKKFHGETAFSVEEMESAEFSASGREPSAQVFQTIQDRQPAAIAIVSFLGLAPNHPSQADLNPTNRPVIAAMDLSLDRTDAWKTWLNKGNADFIILPRLDVSLEVLTREDPSSLEIFQQHFLLVTRETLPQALKELKKFP